MDVHQPFTLQTTLLCPPVCPTLQCTRVNVLDKFLHDLNVFKYISLCCLQHLILLTSYLLWPSPCLLGHHTLQVFLPSSHCTFSVFFAGSFPLLFPFLSDGLHLADPPSPSVASPCCRSFLCVESFFLPSLPSEVSISQSPF